MVHAIPSASQLSSTLSVPMPLKLPLLPKIAAAALLFAPLATIAGESEVPRSVEIATCVVPFMTIATNTGLSQAARSVAQQRVDALLAAFDDETTKDAAAQGISKQLAIQNAQDRGKARNSAILGAAAANSDRVQQSRTIGAHLENCTALGVKVQAEHLRP